MGFVTGVFPCVAWIAALAAAARLSGAEPEGPRLRDEPFQLTSEDRSWWAFQPVRASRPPAIGDPTRVVNPIDAFLLSRLEAEHLTPNPPATRRELIRRAHFDLLGLPPTPEAVAAFEDDSSPDAWERLVDDLLARPQYGERWARHWLDLVRYGESNGYERDGAKPHAWRYRDYVIRSFNADKPYDRFVTEQLAGDELPEGFVADGVVATGFYRLHVWDDEPDSALAADFDDLDDIMVTTSAAFLGLTVGCARCHDHKFDPLSQADYYRLLAYFRSINPYGVPHRGGGGRGTGRITRPLASRDTVVRWESARAARLQSVRARLATVTDAASRQRMEAEIKAIAAEAPPFGQALAIAEDPVKPTHILRRGEVQNPGAEVGPGVPGVFGTPAPAIEIPAGRDSSGRRLALARWIADPANPLTARVIVNRLWQHHFGRGLVVTPNDFGRTGVAPTHPDLLDYLARELVAGGWRLKRMHKLILTSQAYRMSSRADRPGALARDEANTWFWRQNPRRAEAEVVRDVMLATSGTLNPKMGGPGVFPTLPREVHGTQDAAGKGWGESPVVEQQRRTIYLVVKRALVSPLLECFDFSTTTVPVGIRPVTTVAPQALMLLNDPFMQEQGVRLEARVTRGAGNDDEAWVRRAFALVVQRPPTALEARLTRDELRRQEVRLTPAADARIRARRMVCVALLNLAEVVYFD